MPAAPSTPISRAMRVSSEIRFSLDRKSTRLNSSHSQISYAVFCLKKKYNAPGSAWKRRPPFDALIQASYLLAFVLSSWLNNVPQLPWQTFLFGSLFAMHSHIFGEVMDIAPDRLSGRQTTATSIGRVRAKFLSASFLFFFFNSVCNHCLLRFFPPFLFSD